MDLTKALLDRDGGYTLRELKKLVKAEREYKIADQQAYHERKDAMQRAKDAVLSGETGVLPKLDTISESINEEGSPEKAQPDEKEEENDDYYLNEGLDEIDDAAFQKIVDLAKAANFTTEEEAKEFFKRRIEEEWSIKKRFKQRPVDKPVSERLLNDPYYHALKRPDPVQSISPSAYHLDKKTFH